MQTVSATHAKQNFAALLDQSQREPVRIQRHERDIAVLVSAEEYERMVRDRWREFDRLSALASAQAQANGLTEEKLQEILAER
jgi:prevent-host-death family protein